MNRALGWSAGLLALGCLLLWLAPLLIDGDRFREPIARIASAAAGRPVRIEGAVGIELLPEPVLTASRVSVPDPGDGIALSMRSLRLRISLSALLTGRVEARELVLRHPELDLPWPLAPGALTRRLPAWITGFSAQVEDGLLRLGGPDGQVSFSAIDARVGTDADTGALAADGSMQVFAHDWHFTARLGRPGTDGIAGLEVTADGQGVSQDTGGKLSGRVLADGTLVGEIMARGPDLGAVLPAPAVAWQAEGRLAAAAGLVNAHDLSLLIAGSPARGSVSMLVGPSPRLDLTLAVGRLDLDAWLPAVLRGAPSLPTGIDLSAQAATLAGATLRALHGQFQLGESGVEVRGAEAILPGETLARVRGLLATGTSGASFNGHASLIATDLRPMLDWLRPQVVGLPDNLLAALVAVAPRQAELDAAVNATRDAIAFDAIFGTVERSAVGGKFRLVLGSAPQLAVDLATDRLNLTTLLPLVPRFAHLRPPDLPIALKVASQQTVLGPVTLDAFGVDAALDRHGIAVNHLVGRIGDATLLASGNALADGGVRGGRLSVTVPDATTILHLLPPNWRGPAAIWQGRLDCRAALDGQAGEGQAGGGQAGGGLSLTANLALGDLRIDALLSDAGQSWSGPFTLRHPGASRLASALGLGDADWLGDGSAAMVAQLSATARLISLNDVQLNAGTLRTTGSLSIADPFGLDGGLVSITAGLDATSLPVPSRWPWHGPLSLAWLDRLQASLTVSAASLKSDGQTIASDVAAHVVAGSRALRVDLAHATVAGGDLSGHASLAIGDDGVPAVEANGSLTGALVSQPLLGLPIDITAGTLDTRFSLAATGHGPAALAATGEGTIDVAVRNGTLVGFDLGQADAALLAHAANAALPSHEADAALPSHEADAALPSHEADAALPSHEADAVETALREALLAGSTGFATLSGEARLKQGVATLRDLTLGGSAGGARLSGTIDALSRLEDFQIALQPAVADAPALGLRIAGTQRATDLTDALLWRGALAGR